MGFWGPLYYTYNKRPLNSAWGVGLGGLRFLVSVVGLAGISGSDPEIEDRDCKCPTSFEE